MRAIEIADWDKGRYISDDGIPNSVIQNQNNNNFHFIVYGPPEQFHNLQRQLWSWQHTTVMSSRYPSNFIHHLFEYCAQTGS